MSLGRQNLVKHLPVILLGLLLLTFCEKDQRAKERDWLLSRDGRRFIVLPVQHNDTKEHLVMENSLIYWYHRDKFNLSRENYQQDLKRLLENDTLLTITDETAKELENHFTHADSEIDSIKALGKRRFIEQYFEDGQSIKGTLHGYEQTLYLVKVLSDWGVSVFQSDLTGRLVMIDEHPELEH